MFKTIAYVGLVAAVSAGGHFAITLAQRFTAEQMDMYQSLATPGALNAAGYGTNADQVRAGLQAVANDGQAWAAQQVQQPQQ